jgi:shikimate dehydrogenase
VAVVYLIGRHIYYSASPPMQNAAFAALGVDHTYEMADVSVDDLPRVMADLRKPDFLGANVTTPHKAVALELLDQVEPLAARAKAVNTIVPRKGKLIGFNTDIPAIAEQVAALRPSPHQAVVLGRGGAARAVAIALESAGAQEVTLVSRSGGEGSAPWEELPELVRDADLLVNATPVGTDANESPIPAALLHADLAVLDLVYRPSPTRLVREARKVGAPSRGGAGVLLGQGWRSLEKWLATHVSDKVREAMAAALRSELGKGADV